jgi:phage repressor protein C with HTH and peptisase S24 domain
MIDKDRKQWRLTEQGKKVAYTAGARFDRERVAAGQASLSL